MSWETFKVGDFIIPYRDKYHKDTRMIFDGYSSREVEVEPPTYDAVPGEILGIALPYLVLQNVDSKHRFTVDLRRWDVITCDKEYVRCFVKEAYIPTKGKVITQDIKTQDNIDLCPRCREKMISFRPERVEIGYSNWSLRCKKCKIECREYK